jgi:hypothetical protein
VFVTRESETPFDSLEGSYEYLAMLGEALSETRLDVEEQMASADRNGVGRRKEALLLVAHKLAKLDLHIASSRRILNDLRHLRRLLLVEQRLVASSAQAKVFRAGQ